MYFVYVKLYIYVICLCICICLCFSFKINKLQKKNPKNPNYSSKINKTNNHLSIQDAEEKTRIYELEIGVLFWDINKYVAILEQLLGSQLHADNWISNENTDIIRQ
jgi:hypothetical protein